MKKCKRRNGAHLERERLNNEAKALLDEAARPIVEAMEAFVLK